MQNTELTKFSFDTIQNFDEHINISIPGYDSLQQHILNISSFFIKDDTIMYDFGCSTGKLINNLKRKHNTNTTYIGIDKSEAMAEHESFIEIADLSDYELSKFFFGTFIFTLQFMSVESRKAVLKRAYDNLQEGGAIIIAEKQFINDGYLQDLFAFSYYDFKRQNFSAEEILSKQVDLRYIMRPLSEEENLKMFQDAGFTKIQKFWQSLQFNAYILIK